MHLPNLSRSSLPPLWHPNTSPSNLYVFSLLYRKPSNYCCLLGNRLPLLTWSCTRSHSCSQFLSAMPMPHLDTASHNTLPRSPDSTFFLPAPNLGVRIYKDVPFKAERSTVVFSQHPNLLWIFTLIGVHSGNRLLWPRLREAAIHGLKHKYLEKSFTAWPLSKHR